jgi:hypothetical protein
MRAVISTQTGTAGFHARFSRAVAEPRQLRMGAGATFESSLVTGS